MGLYRKKPVVIEAVLFDGSKESTAAVLRLGGGTIGFTTKATDAAAVVLQIKTLEGTMTADIGDYVIRGVKGEVYPCKPDIFEATYEPVEGG